MKILFIVNMEDLGFEEPLGVLYLSSVCKKEGHTAYISENNYNCIEKMIKDKKPDLLAVSVLTPSFPYLFDTVREVRQKYNIPVIMGGPHPTFFPEIIKEDQIDYVIVGEGEHAFSEFLEKYSLGEKLDDIRNLVLKTERGSFKKNQVRPLVSDLDSILFPDRELFCDYKQFDEADVRSVMASRGCPYGCSYCYNNQYQEMYKGLGSKVRVRSVDNVVEECLELKNRYHAKMIHFFDDIFPFNNQWVEDFADRYSKKVRLPFFTNTSFSVCSEHYISNLSRAGCKTLLIGVETGNEAFREKVLFRRMSNEMIVQKAKLIHKYGIKIYTQNIIGIPYGSLDLDLETVKLNIDIRPEFSGSYLCQPYPKTAIEKMAKEANLLDEKFDVSRSFYYSSPLKLKDKRKIERLRVVFPLVVNFPVLFRFISIILKMPAYPFQISANLLHGYKIKTVILRYNMPFTRFLKNIKLFFSRRINTVFHPEITVK